MPHASSFRSRLQATAALGGSSIVWYRFGGLVFTCILVCTAAFAVLAWVAPRAYEPIQRAFDFATRIVLKGVSWLSLGIVYFGVFLPLRIWRRAIGSDPLALRSIPAATTYFVPLDAKRRNRFDRQF